MKTAIAAAAAIVLFAAGMGAGLAAKKAFDTGLYHGRPPAQAAQALLDEAREQARGGSWEMIGIGRAYYLGGDKARGQAIFDGLLGGEHEDSDVFRIARVYQEAGEWSKAKPLFDRYVSANQKDESGLAEVGAYYILQGDRAQGEALIDRSVARKPDVWTSINAAGAYLGVRPQ